MRLEQDNLAKVKNIIHEAQGFIIFLAWILTIAVFTQTGSSDGRTGWYFGLCWLSIPILVYLVMVPMWSRARRFSNLYAFVALDVLSTILWLSAWAAVASYVASGKGKGKSTTKDGCDNFFYGSPPKCKLSEATIILGVIVMLLFVATSFISFQAVMHFRRTGEMPSTNATNDSAAQTQDAFSSNLRQDELDDDDLDPRQGGRPGPGPARHSEDDEYALLHHADNDDVSQVHPTEPSGPIGYGPRNNVVHDYDTSYGGAPGRYSPQPPLDAGYGSGPGSYGR